MNGERPLPMAGDRDPRPDGAEGGGPDGLPRPVRVEASAVRLVSTLTFAGALAGLVIVLVHQWAQPRIDAHQARILREAVVEVLGGPDRYDTAFLDGSTVTTEPGPAADTAAMDRVYVGYDGSGRRVGIAIVGGQPGFQDVIRLIFGYDPATGRVLGMKVLESKETPGLGDKIEKDSAFVAEFDGVATPLFGVKSGAGSGVEGEVDMITGATISSRTVVDIINDRVDALADPLAAWWGRSAAAGGGDGPAVAAGGGLP